MRTAICCRRILRHGGHLVTNRKTIIYTVAPHSGGHSLSAGRIPIGKYLQIVSNKSQRELMSDTALAGISSACFSIRKWQTITIDFDRMFVLFTEPTCDHQPGDVHGGDTHLHQLLVQQWLIYNRHSIVCEIVVYAMAASLTKCRRC